MNQLRHQVAARRGIVRMAFGATAAVLTLVAVTACGGGGPKSDEDAIRQVIGDELDAIHHEDWGALFDLQSPDRREACDREGWKSALAAIYGEAYEDTSKVGYDVSEVVVEGDGATVTLTESYDGEDVGTDDFRYKKVDGRWHSAETNCPGGSDATSDPPADAGGAASNDVQDNIATVIEAMERIMDDDDADLDEALAMKSTVAAIIQALGPGTYQADMLDDAWRTFVRHAEGEDASDRTLAISVDPTGVVRQLQAAAGLLKRQASDQTRTANANRTPAVNRTATTATTRVATPTPRVATSTAGRPDGPYGTVATATLILNGQTFHLSGGRCTITDAGKIFALDITSVSERLSLRMGSSPGVYTLDQVLALGRQPGGSVDFRTGDSRWITTSGAGTAFTLSADFNSGTFVGPFIQGGGEPADVTGSFTC